jgi:hypothetical protein
MMLLCENDQLHYGGYDVVVRKLDLDGSEQWTRQFGTAEDDTGADVAVDSTDNLYISGYTHGAFPGQTHYGEYDAFLIKYDANGNEQWTRQFGTSSSNIASGVAVDLADNIYMVGFTNEAFPGQTHYGGYDVWVRKLDSDGSEQWTRQFGTASDDYGRRIAVDSGANVYVTGHTKGAFPDQMHYGGADIWVRKLDSDGSEQWTRQFGTPAYDRAYGLACDQNDNIYLMGETDAAFPGQMHYGSTDIWVRKLSSDGSEQWTRQFGTTEDEYGYSIACDQSDNVHIAGETMGVFPDQTHYGATDLFFRQYDPFGSTNWIKQYGTPSEDVAPMIAVDSTNNVYVTGFTDGAFPGQTYYGGYDAFLIKYNPLLATTISATLSAVELRVHAPINISGTISEPVAGVPVTVTYTIPNGTTITRTTTTNAEGAYLDTYTPTVIGDWSVSVYWDGDLTYRGASSSSNAFTVTKIPTTLTCLTSSSEVKINEAITITGAIEPLVASVPVTLTIYNPDDSPFETTVMTASDGSYSERYTVDVEGSWSVYALWDGDSTHDGASSGETFFGVTSGSCLIATATYGSELSPEVQFLRTFRANTVLATFTGQQFMTVFNGIYYSFSPTVASGIAGNDGLRTVMQRVLYPLIQILQFGEGVTSLFSFSTDLGIIMFCLVVSALLSFVYLVPWALLLSYWKQHLISKQLIQWGKYLLLGSIAVLLVAVLVQSPFLTMVGGACMVLLMTGLTTLVATRVIMKRLIPS